MEKDKSKLTKKQITDKTGKTTSVWVKTDADAGNKEHKTGESVEWNKETYNPKNKTHWLQALSDLKKEGSKAKTTKEHAENDKKLKEAVKQGQKHGHIKTDQQKEIDKINKKREQDDGGKGRHTLNVGLTTSGEIYREIFDTTMNLLTGGIIR